MTKGALEVTYPAVSVALDGDGFPELRRSARAPPGVTARDVEFTGMTPVEHDKDAPQSQTNTNSQEVWRWIDARVIGLTLAVGPKKVKRSTRARTD